MLDEITKTSGKHIANRMSTSFLFFITELISFPIQRAGFSISSNISSLNASFLIFLLPFYSYFCISSPNHMFDFFDNLLNKREYFLLFLCFYFFTFSSLAWQKIKHCDYYYKFQISQHFLGEQNTIQYYIIFARILLLIFFGDYHSHRRCFLYRLYKKLIFLLRLNSIYPNGNFYKIIP